jgi:hypothetical protein
MTRQGAETLRLPPRACVGRKTAGSAGIVFDLSPEVKATIDGGPIRDHQVCNEPPPSEDIKLP